MSKAVVYAVCAVAVVLLVLDVVWLTTVMSKLFKAQVPELMREPVAKLPAALFYAIYVAAIMGLVILRPDVGANVARAFLFGAALGFVAYATYDLTNLATLKAWPLSLAMLDIAWGTLVTAVSAGAGAYAYRLGSS